MLGRPVPEEVGLIVEFIVVPPASLPLELALQRGAPAPAGGRTRRLWDDRAERDARELVASLFVAAGALRRADLAEALRCSQARLARRSGPARRPAPAGDRARRRKLVEAVLHLEPPEELA